MNLDLVTICSIISGFQSLDALFIRGEFLMNTFDDVAFRPSVLIDASDNILHLCNHLWLFFVILMIKLLYQLVEDHMNINRDMSNTI